MRMSQSRRDELPDHYETLEVSPRASSEVIQAAYRVLARNAHPDRNHDGDAEQRIRRLNAAYAVLGDPGHRAKYDLECTRARRGERLRIREVEPGAARPVGRPELVRAVPRRSSVMTARDDRSYLISPRALVLACALIFLGLALAAVVWLSVGAALSDDAASVDALPIHTRAVIRAYPYAPTFEGQ
jgi:hypothetical protein